MTAKKQAPKSAEKKSTPKQAPKSAGKKQAPKVVKTETQEPTPKPEPETPKVAETETPKVAAKKKTTPKSEKGDKGTNILREIVCRDPFITEEDAVKAMNAKGVTLKESTAHSLYYHTMRAMRCCIELGLRAAPKK